MTNKEIDALIAQGYCRTSRKHCLVSRIDTANWRAKVRNLRHLQPGAAEDFYRRVHSKDVLRVSTSDIRLFPGSSWNPIGYIYIRPENKQTPRETIRVNL